MPRCRRLGGVCGQCAISSQSHVKAGHGLSVSVRFRREQRRHDGNTRPPLYGCRPRGAAHHVPTRSPSPALVLRRCERAICDSGTLGGRNVAHEISRDTLTAHPFIHRWHPSARDVGGRCEHSVSDERLITSRANVLPGSGAHSLVRTVEKSLLRRR